MATTETCDICRARASMTPLVEAGLLGVGPVWIHRCGGCGFRQVRPRLDPAALETVYGGDYFDGAPDRGFTGYARQRQRYDRDAFFLAREIRALGETGRLLEVGSALGFLLDALARRSRWCVEGVELSAFGAWYARTRFGVTVHQTTLESARLPAATFDYVVQKDLLEHVVDPRHHLAETCRIMRPGGRLRVITPNGDADIRPLQRAAAGASGDVPVLGQGHLSFFSRAQIEQLVTDSGFRLLRLRNIGIRRGIHALGLVPGWRARARLVRRDTLTEAGGAASGGEATADAGFEARAARIDAEVARCHRRVRAWPPYFHYRQLVKRADAWPRAMTLGQDFDLLLEKR